MKKAIICDLDGTLCLYDRSTGKHYDRDYENDTPNQAVLDVLYRIDQDNFDGIGEWTDIIFVSGRKDSYRNVTRKWLDDWGLKIYPLFMRSETDRRPDDIVKKEIYDNNIKDKYSIVFVMDDRNRVVNLWRSLGLTCFQVAEGNF